MPNEGERSLLHYAVSYGNVNVVRWLCSELIDKGICVDIRDAGGMTPLHDAAKSGNVTVCHELILAGADPLSQVIHQRSCTFSFFSFSYIPISPSG